MKFVFDDGGRAAAGYKGFASDCCCRSIAIGTGKPYQEVYETLNRYAQLEKRVKGRSHSRTGVKRETWQRYLEDLGWTWVPTMKFGTGCKVHVKAEELPSGTLILRLSKHFTTVIDGVLHDTFDCSRNETRCVYGYFCKR
jgi:hypothetical protein